MSTRPPNEDAWLEERTNLQQVTEDIDRELEEIQARAPQRAAFQGAANALQENDDKRRGELHRARPRPYEGRVDVIYIGREGVSGNPRQTVYVGTVYKQTTISGTAIVNFASPAAAAYYNPTRVSIPGPNGEIPVATVLKRVIGINDGEIIRLTEELRRDVGAVAPTVDVVLGTEALTQAVSGTGADDGHLQIIIGTIDPDQYKRIANVNDQVLIVQGAAGSGKSEIGLHRIAYLLSPFSELGDREKPTPDSILFLGPSRSFLEYASDILPQLGVEERVLQTTFGEWVSSLHSKRLSIRSRIWNHLLDKGELRDYDAEAESFKGSIAMADALDRHVLELARGIRAALRDIQPFRVRISSGTQVAVTKGDLRDAAADALSRGGSETMLNRRRRRFFRLLTDNIVSHAGGIGRRRPDEARQFRRDIEARLENSPVADAWPVFSSQEVYAGLFNDPEQFSQLTSYQVSKETAAAMARGIRMMTNPEFNDPDRAALTYFDHLLNDTITARFNHIVVDEAQDLSPLDFKLLRLASTNGWFTILGDTSQRLMPHRGIRRWRDLDRVLGRAITTVQHARLSYRATKQITRFNNRILRLFNTAIDAPLPFDREGHRVEYVTYDRSEDMYRGVVGELTRIRTLQGLEMARIGILARDQRNLRAFYEYCQRHGVTEVALFGEESLDSPSVLARISVTQGLEYDAVIVLGVNDAFRSTEFNRKLLYLACSRAKHYLALHWFGAPSPILNEISDRGINR